MLLGGILKYKINTLILNHLQYGLSVFSFGNSTKGMELMFF